MIMTLIDTIRWILTVPLLLVSAYFIVTNIRFLFENIRLGLDAGSAPVTVIGGLSGCIGLLIMPVMTFGERLGLIWILLFLDLGSAPFYLGMLVLAVWQHLNSRIWRKHPDFIEGGINNGFF